MGFYRRRESKGSLRSMFAAFTPTVLMGGCGIATQFSQRGWRITQNTATFTTSRVAFVTGASALRRRWATCLEWKIAVHRGTILCTGSCGKMTLHKVWQISSVGMLTPGGTFSGVLRASSATFQNQTYYIRCRSGC